MTGDPRLWVSIEVGLLVGCVLFYRWEAQRTPVRRGWQLVWLGFGALAVGGLATDLVRAMQG